MFDDIQTKRISELQKLGFSSIEQYFKSLLFKTICKEILEDSNKCESRRCSKEAIAAVPLSHLASVLSGGNPACFVSVCRDCLIDSTVDARAMPLDPTLALNKLLFLVSGTRRVPKVDHLMHKVHRWFQERYKESRHQAMTIKLWNIFEEDKQLHPYLKYWEAPVKDLWTAPFVTDEELENLRILIRTSHQDTITLIRKDGNKLIVMGKKRGFSIWTKEQLKHIVDRGF